MHESDWGVESMEVRRQVKGVSFLLPCGSWGLNSKPSGLVVSAFSHLVGT